MKVVGIDLSLTGTGVCEMEANAEQVTGWVTTIKSTGKRDDTLVMRDSRIDTIVRRIGENLKLNDVTSPAPDLIVIESPSYGSNHGSAHDRSGLWWITVSSLIYWGLPVATVSPNGRAKYGAGKGNASKDQVLAAVVRNTPWLDIDNNNEADAVVLATMGLRHLGRPIDMDTDYRLQAIEGAAWPT